MMKENKLKKMLAEGQTVIGTFIKSTDPAVTEMVCMSGFDFVVIDNEHSAMAKETMVNHIRACEIHDITPIVRVRANDPSQILQALDAGGMGAMVTNLRTIEDAVHAVKCTKYAPMGFRGFAASQRVARYGLVNAEEYAKYANENTLTICYCETKEAVDNLDEIVRVEGIDIIFIGPADLSQWYGVIGQTKNKLVMDAIDTIIEKTTKAGKICGIVANDGNGVNYYQEKGVRFIIMSSDLSLINYSSQRMFEQIKVKRR